MTLQQLSSCSRVVIGESACLNQLGRIGLALSPAYCLCNYELDI